MSVRKCMCMYTVCSGRKKFERRQDERMRDKFKSHFPDDEVNWVQRLQVQKQYFLPALLNRGRLTTSLRQSQLIRHAYTAHTLTQKHTYTQRCRHPHTHTPHTVSPCCPHLLEVYSSQWWHVLRHTDTQHIHAHTTGLRLETFLEWNTVAVLHFHLWQGRQFRLLIVYEDGGYLPKPFPPPATLHHQWHLGTQRSICTPYWVGQASIVSHLTT